MKKTLKLIPAIAMLLVSAILVSTATFAWFSMNTQVTAKGMQVKAKAEGGIVIAPYAYSSSVASVVNETFNDTLSAATFTAPAASAFTNEATVASAAAELYPTSTLTGLAHWYHAASNAVDNYAAATPYAVLDTTYTLENDGKAYSGDGTVAAKAYELQGQYYLLNKFQIKATDAGTYSVWLTGITVSNNHNPATSTDLNKALRICVVIGGNYYFYAPQYETGTLYYYNGSSRTAWAADAIKLGAVPNNVVSTNITSTPTDVDVYIYYEGEDINCKSINAINIDTLTVDLTFSSINPA